MSAMAEIEDKFEAALTTLVPINGLSQARRQQLLSQAEVLQYRPREFVFREGDRDSFSFYVLDGQLELYAQGQLVKRVNGGTEDACHPLARLQPRQLTARAKNQTSVLRIDRNLLDKLLAIDGQDEPAQIAVSESLDNDGGDWMTKMLQSELFSRVPAANIQRIFASLQEVPFKAGETVVSQDEPGDFYYIIQQGRCEVTRTAATGKMPIKLAELVAGDSFGEEALVSDALRNATVSMLTDGSLMRLTKEDFVELIRSPLLSEVSLDEGRQLVNTEGAIWVDVRFPEEHASGAIAGSVNQPLNTLRMHAERLDRDKTYIVFCDSGARSSSAAFLLSERGFDVHCLAGGLAEYGILSATEQRFSVGDEADLTIHGDDDGPIQVAALVPASHKAESESGIINTGGTEEVLAADLKAQALKAELAKADIKLDEARRLKEQAEEAKRQAQKVVSEELAVEKERLANEAAKAKAAFEEAENLKRELAKARQKAQHELAHARQKEADEAEQLRKELEATKKKALEDSQRFKQIEARETENLKRELEAVKKKAFEDTQRFKAIEAESNEKLRLEIEEAKRQAAEQAERLKQEEAENAARLKRELEETKRIAQEEAARAKQKEAEELERVNQLIEEARREKEAAEAARVEMEREAERKIAEEQAKLAAQAEQAQKQIEEAARLKEELELERQRAEQEADEKRRAHEEQLERLRDEAEIRLKQQELELQTRFEEQASVLAELQDKKAAAEEELARQRDELRSEASEAKKRLAEAKRIQTEVEQAREESAREAEDREQRQREIEERLANDIRAQLDSERHKLEAEFARNAEELERARKEREAAEAARVKAAQDAERIIEDYKRTHEELREKEQAKLRAERERLESESQRLRESLDEARRTTELAQRSQQNAEKEIGRLKERQEQADPNSTLANKIVVDIAELEAEVNAARAEVSAAEAVEKEVLAAAEANTEHLVQQRIEETDSRSRFEEDIDNWISEQNQLENSDIQQEILANQKAHLERIKNRAVQARKAAKDHDQSLIDELANQLKIDD